MDSGEDSEGSEPPPTPSFMPEDGNPAPEGFGAERQCPGEPTVGGTVPRAWAGLQGPWDALLLNEHQLSSPRQSTCDTMPNHSETISHTVNVPLQTALGTLEEIAC